MSKLPNNAYGTVQYPVGVEPDDLGCHEFEVRQNGVLLPRIVVRYSVRAPGALAAASSAYPDGR